MKKAEQFLWGKPVAIGGMFGRKIGTFLVSHLHLPLLVVAFLLGRTVMMEEMSPFAIPFFVVMFAFYRSRWALTALALVLGASTLSLTQVTFTLSGILIYFLLYGLFIRREQSFRHLPFLTFVTSVGARFVTNFMTGHLSVYEGVLSVIEGLLAAVLVLLMVQTFPLLSRRHKQQSLKHEEVVTLVILLASIATGTASWVVADVSVVHVLTRLLVLTFAFAAGGPLGAAVGVVTGLILGLSSQMALEQMAMEQMGILAFAGLLAGLMKNGGRLAAAGGVFLGAGILSLTFSQMTNIWVSLIETACAAGLFFLIPARWVERLAVAIPGTKEYFLGEQAYVQRVREVTAQKVRDFAQVFQQLSQLFVQEKVPPAKQEEFLMNTFMNDIVAGACSTCPHRKRCWEEQSFQSYQMFMDMLSRVEKSHGEKIPMPSAWKKHCIKPHVLVKQMSQGYPMLKQDIKWYRQLSESRYLVADQLSGVAGVMRQFASDIEKEVEEMTVQEEQIKDALEGLGLSIRNVEIYSLEGGNVHIEVTQHSSFGREACERIVAPLLTELLGENIGVKNHNYEVDRDGYCTIALGSEKKYEVKTGIATAAKGGGLLSGDSYSVMEMGNGQLVVAISDGMGNGRRAREESKAAIDLLKDLLHSGFDEALAIKTINTVLSLRSPEEMYATVDLALIDLFEARAKFLKVGSTPSFVKRSEQVFSISGDSPPAGILRDIEVEGRIVQLKAGDMLVLMTDGLFEAPERIQDNERWMRRIIGEIQSSDPQEFADLLLEYVVRELQGQILDDMTVVVAKVEQYMPEWATIALPYQSHWFNRPQVMSS